MGESSTARVIRLRERRRRGDRRVTPLETDAEERRRLVALGYLADAEGRATLAEGAQAYFSDKIAAEKVTRHTA